MQDEAVLKKAEAAVIWCKNATVHATKFQGKPWRYLLMPDDQITSQMTLDGLVATCLYSD